MRKILFSKTIKDYYVGITDWSKYAKNLYYVLIREQDGKEKSFLIEFSAPHPIAEYADVIADYLRGQDEVRQENGSLAVTELTLPKIGLIL